MIGRLFFLAAFILIFSHAKVCADSLNALPESGRTEKASALKPTDPCQNARYAQKKFRPEVIKDLPFPPGAFVEMKRCDDAGLPEQPDSTGAELKREEIEKQKTIQKLSLLLSTIFYQQKNLAGSYRETDRVYDDLLKRNLPNPKAYDQAVSSYEDTLKNQGEYEAYLSALPRAVSDYEKKMGSSFNDFVFQKADGGITLMKTPSPSDLSNPPYDLQVKTGESATAQKTPGELEPQPGNAKERGSRREWCTFMGAIAGAGAAENVVLAALANPMGVLLGASLGATLCSETLYGKMTGLQRRLGEGLVEMGSYIKEGLSKIGSGLYNISRTYLYKTPSNTGAKIAQHYEDTKSWLNRKLGWN